MSDTVVVAIIASIPGIIAAITALVKLRQVEVKLDGRLTELLDLTRKSSRAEGVKDEFDRVK